MSESDGIDGADLIRQRDRGTAPGTAEARAVMAEWDRQDAALAALYGGAADEPVPDRLLATLARADALRPPRWPWRLAAALALVAVGAAGGFVAGARLGGPPGNLPLATEALLAHATYAVEVRHPVEVAAADEAHLVAWLSKRLGHQIRPPDFAAHGFHLIGGRVLPEAHGAAAQLMYEDAAGRRITLYVAREPGRGETAFRFTEQGQAQGFWWIDDGIGCAVIGDLPKDELRSIAVAAYDQLL